MPKPKQTFGSRLRLARERKQMTGLQAAVALGVDIRTVYRWERDQFDPGVRQVVRLCALYGVSPTWLLMGHAPAPSFGTDNGPIAA